MIIIIIMIMNDNPVRAHTYRACKGKNVGNLLRYDCW